jgi:hypothetical protein
MSEIGHLTHSVGVFVLPSLIVRYLSRTRTAGRCAVLLPLSGKSQWHTANPNLILPRLTASEFQLIEADLEDLIVRKLLKQPRRRIGSLYFPESGFASVVANGAGKKPIEVGIIGREGMTGLAVLLGNERSKKELPLRHEFLAMMLGVTRPGVTVAVKLLE